MKKGKKKSILIYSDFLPKISKLSDEQAGKLFKGLLNYSNGITPEFDDILLDYAFEDIKTTIDRDSEKYSLKCLKNKEIAIERERIKRERNNTNVNERVRNSTNSTDRDNDIDSDSDKDIDIDNDILLEKETKHIHEKIFDFEKVWYSFQGKKNTYEKDLKNFNLKTDGLDVDFEKLFYEAKKSKNIYFQNWINDLFPKYTKKVAQKKEKESLEISNEFLPIWTKWKDYRKDSKIKNYAGVKWEQIALNKLIELSNNNPKLADEIVNQSIENNYNGLFPLKNNSYGNTKTPTNQFNSNQSQSRTGRQILAERLINSTKANGESGSTIIDVEAL